MNEIDLDFQRQDRQGFPELVYGEYKTADQISRIIGEHREKELNCLVTRVQQEKAYAVLQDHPDLEHDDLARTLILRLQDPVARAGHIGIISAGTSDVPVVRECVQTAAFLGYAVTAFNDIGVAGIHRLQRRLPDLEICDVLICVAGFEGALPSVLAGLVAQPVIGVPTSVGYGVSDNGKTALNAMLCSCATGLTVTNIDNGCGAVMAACRILETLQKT
jgi:NCAIR mutase (PurE)-related protein